MGQDWEKLGQVLHILQSILQMKEFFGKNVCSMFFLASTSNFKGEYFGKDCRAVVKPYQRSITEQKMKFPTADFFSESKYVPKYASTSVYSTQKMKFSIKDFFSKCDQTRGKLQICSHLLKKSFMENFILGAVYDGDFLQKNYLQKDPLYVNLTGFEYIYLLKVNNRNTRIR